MTLYWACYEQQGNTLTLFAADNTDRRINLGFWETEIPVTWFQSFNPLMIFAFTPFALACGHARPNGAAEPNSIRKMTIGCICHGGGESPDGGAVVLAGEIGKTDWLWLFVYSAILTWGEIYLSPIGLSLYSRVSPHQIVSTMIAVNFIPMFLGGGFLQGYLGTFWSTMAKEDFFLMIAPISAAAGVIIWLFDKPLRPILERSLDVTNERHQARRGRTLALAARGRSEHARLSRLDRALPRCRDLPTDSQPYTYGRRGTPTTRALEDALCELEGGARTVLTPSGLSACTLAILTVCGAGDHILVTDVGLRPDADLLPARRQALRHHHDYLRADDRPAAKLNGAVPARNQSGVPGKPRLAHLRSPGRAGDRRSRA